MTFDEWALQQGYTRNPDHGRLEDYDRVPVDEDMLRAQYQKAALFGAAGTPIQDIVIGGQPFAQIGGYANNDPDQARALQLEIDNLKRFGIEPVYSDQYGWVVPNDAKLAQAHPAQSPNSFDRVLGTVMPGAIGAGMFAGVGAGLSGLLNGAGATPNIFDELAFDPMAGQVGGPGIGAGGAAELSLADLAGRGAVQAAEDVTSAEGGSGAWEATSGAAGSTAADTAKSIAAKTALAKFLNGETLSPSDLTKLLGTLGSTALGVAGGMDQSNAIREANDKNAAAFAAAQQRAMATLTEGQRQALKSSGAGKEEAIKAYKASLAEAVRYNEQALKSGVSGFESGRDAAIKASTDALASGLGYNEKALGKSLSGLQETRDQSLAMSNAARDEGMGILRAAQTGALDANRGTEERYFGIGAPARERLEASYRPGFSMNNEPGYKDAIDQVMNSYLRKASVGGNPFENPGVSMEANKYVTAGTALPQLNTYRSQNAASGNVGLDTAGSAGLQRPGIYSSLGQLQSNLSSDFGKFDANLNTNAGTNMANVTSRAGEFGTNLISDTGRSVAGAAERGGTNIGGANLTAGQYNTGLIDRSGSNVAGANLTTGQNDANLIGNLAKAGAQVQGGTYNTVPTSNSGVYNALGSGLASLTNPQQDYSAVLNQILKQYQLANGRSL